jgi:protein ImuA
MRLIASHNGKLLTLNPNGSAAAGRSFSSGLADWDALAPGGAFARGAIHELLTTPADGKAMFAAMVLASFGEKGQSARKQENPSSSLSHAIIWCDPANELYPPALAAHGFPLDRLFLLHPKIPDPKGKELIWAIAECLRCKGVGAVVAAPPRLSRIQARRLQLAAEQGGGVGLLLRHVGRDSACHAAATRWLIRPAPGGRNVQRWTIQLLHGHGGRIGQTLCLEHCRETNHLHTFDPMADRSVAEKSIAS